MKKIFFPILIMLLTLFISSCSKSPKNKILGYWESIKDNTYAVAFYKNNTVILRPVAGKGNPALLYNFVDDNTIKIKNENKWLLLKVTFKGNNILNIGTADGVMSFTLRRIKESRFKQVAINAAKKIYIAKIMNSLKTCLVNLEATAASAGVYKPIHCNIGYSFVVLFYQDGGYYFLKGDELNQEHKFSNDIVSVNCSFDKMNLTCK